MSYYDSIVPGSLEPSRLTTITRARKRLKDDRDLGRFKHNARFVLMTLRERIYGLRFPCAWMPVLSRVREEQNRTIQLQIKVESNLNVNDLAFQYH